MPRAVVAVDLAESREARERAAGLGALKQVIEAERSRRRAVLRALADLQNDLGLVE